MGDTVRDNLNLQLKDMTNLITIEEYGFCYTIRLSKPEDFEQVFDIWFNNQKNSTGLDNTKPLDLLKDEFKNNFSNQTKNFKFWIAETDGKVIGYQATNRTEPNPLLANEQAESSTYVHKDYWGLGVAYRLMQKCLDDLPYTDIKLLFGKMVFNNKAIVKLVEDLGFQLIGEFPPTLKKPINAVTYLYVYNVPEPESKHVDS
jgi:phosphinothricin acetyltransferase